MKKLTAVLLALAMLMSLCACGAAKEETPSVEEQLRTQTEEFFDSVKNFDDATVSQYLDNAWTEEGSSLDFSEYFSVDTTALESAMVGYFSDCASKMTYEITSVDEEALTVEVSVRYIDSTAFTEAFCSGVISWCMANLLTGELSDADAVTEALTDIINDAADADTEDTFLTGDVTLTFEEADDGTYSVANVSDGMLDVVTAGFFPAMLSYLSDNSIFGSSGLGDLGLGDWFGASGSTDA